MIDQHILIVAGVTMLAVISPGPDFAVVLRNSMRFGRKTGILTAMGIACGVSVHVAYTVAGFGLVVKEAAWMLDVMRYLGAGYLIWLGICAFRKTTPEADGAGDQGPAISGLAALRQGFFCNALNPKTSLFFIALFTQVVDPATPFVTQLGFGIFIAMAHLVWFALVAWFLTHQRLNHLFSKGKTVIERIVGVCLIGLGGRLLAG